VRELQRDESILPRCAEAAQISAPQRLLGLCLVRARSQCRHATRPRYCAARWDVASGERMHDVVIDLLHEPTAQSMAIDTSSTPWTIQTTVGWISNDDLTDGELDVLRPDAPRIAADDFADLLKLLDAIGNDVPLKHALAQRFVYWEPPSSEDGGGSKSGSPAPDAPRCTHLEAVYHENCKRADVDPRREIREDAKGAMIVGCRSPLSWMGEVVTTHSERVRASMEEEDLALLDDANAPRASAELESGAGRGGKAVPRRSSLLLLVLAAVAAWPDAPRRVAVETIKWLFGAEQRALGYRAFFEHARMLTVSVEANFIRDDTGSFTVDHFVEAIYDKLARRFVRGRSQHRDRQCATPPQNRASPPARGG
jgi:hypothetical protein